MTIAFVLGSLGCGGAERVVSLMANYWAKRGWQVAVITVSSAQGDFYRLDPRVQRTALDLARPSSNVLVGAVNNVRRICRLRRALRAVAPDAVISFLFSTNVLTLLATRGLAVPVVISERASPEYDRLSIIWAELRLRIYPLADAIVAQTPRVGEWLRRRVPRPQLEVIPNPVESVKAKEVGVRQLDYGPKELSQPFLLAVGRLADEKGFDLLIAAFAELADRFEHWHLLILGEGPKRVSLEKLVRELGLEGRVLMPGRRPVGPALVAAEAFVLSSRYEGMPNALMEALAWGLPAVSFDCATGPRELIRDGENGILVPSADVGALSSALARVMADSALRERLDCAARASMHAYRTNVVMARWESLLESLGVRTDSVQDVNFEKPSAEAPHV